MSYTYKSSYVVTTNEGWDEVLNLTRAEGWRLVTVKRVPRDGGFSEFEATFEKESK